VASASTLLHKAPLLYMLGIPALVPAALAAYSVAPMLDRERLITGTRS